MEWKFNVSNGSAIFALRAETIYSNNQIEHIKVTGEGISIVLQSNRPLLQGVGLQRAITWKTIKGKVKDDAALEQIIKGLEKSFPDKNKIA
jgi:hypothetical protein